MSGAGAEAGLTHFDADGKAAMVDVGAKAITERVAIAAGRVVMAPATLAVIAAGQATKGDVLGVARLAGIMAAKRTDELIPLCHSLPLSAVTVDLVCNAATLSVDITARCAVAARTGVEMEALTAVSVAALTVYDMVKAIDKAMVITDIRLLEKSGGRSGLYRAA